MQGGRYTHGNGNSRSVKDEELFRQAERLPASQDTLVHQASRQNLVQLNIFCKFYMYYITE
jgi:hypothetical protein